MNSIKNLLFSLILITLSQLALAQEYRVYKAPTFRYEWSLPSEHPDRIIVNFGQDPSSQVQVTWRTDTIITEAYAEIALATGAPKFWRNATTHTAKTELLDGSQIETSQMKSHHHSVSFNGLDPDTMYAYRVGDGDRWSEWIQFRTASDQKNDKFSFLYVGDTQNFILELWARLIREGYRKAPDAKFIIHAGDLVNRAHREVEWYEWFTAGGFIHSMLPSFPTPGNHEYQAIPEVYGEDSERKLSVQWNQHFTLPENGPEGLKETVYFMDYQDARFISLNSNVEHEKQVEWLVDVLENNPQKWTIITYHHPLFSASEGRENTQLRELWKPIFDKYKVDLALQGHDHSYARGRVSPEENVMNGVNAQDKTGTVYVVSVSGGKMYELKKYGWDYYEAERDRAAENTQLFQVISIENNRLSYESYTAIGELYDAFDLDKQADGSNLFIERKSEAGPEYRFSNTIPYQDPLPTLLENILLSKYPEHEITRVSASENEEGTVEFSVRLEKEEDEINLIIDASGNISEN